MGLRKTEAHLEIGPLKGAFWERGWDGTGVENYWPMQMLQVELKSQPACRYPTLVPHLDPPSIALTHPEIVEALGHAEVLGRDVCLKVLVETWLQWDEFGQWWEVVHSFCG